MIYFTAAFMVHIIISNMHFSFEGIIPGVRINRANAFCLYSVKGGT